MFDINILVERADDEAPVPIKGLNQGVTPGVIPRSVDSVAKGHADQTKSQMIWQRDRSLEMQGRDKVYMRIWPEFTDGDEIWVYARIICPSQFVSAKMSLVAFHLQYSAA